MFNKLLRLCKTESHKTPLEDFTTELVVGILNSDINLRNKFVTEVLKFKDEKITIKTQKHYHLPEEKDCRIDIVIEGDNEICFIENKVNSTQHSEQLRRYSLVLNGYKERGYKTKLIFCTKNSETVNDELGHDFSHIKWFNLARFVDNNSQNELTKQFLSFLTEQKMYFNMEIKSEDLEALKNFNKVYSLFQEHLYRSKTEFEKKFISVKDWTKSHDFYKQFTKYSRMCIVSGNIVEGDNWSEILYGFEFEGKLVVHIYMDKTNENYANFEKEISNQNEMKCEKYVYGARIYSEKNIENFINNDNSELEIKEWFEKGFEKMENFIKNTEKSIKWKKYIA